MKADEEVRQLKEKQKNLRVQRDVGCFFLPENFHILLQLQKDNLEVWIGCSYSE